MEGAAVTAARRFVIAAVVALPLPAAAQEAVPLEAPRSVRAQLNRLAHTNPAVRANAAAELAKDDKNAPFLRFERVAAVTPAHRAALDAALAPIEARTWARHRDRVKEWAKERRLDLVAEYFAACPADDLPATVDHLLRVQQDIHREAFPPPADRGSVPGFIPAGSMAEVRSRWPGWSDAKRFAPQPGSEDWPDGLRFDGRRVRVVTGQDAYGSGALLASGGGLRVTNTSTGQKWGGSSVVLANGRVQLQAAHSVLVVADGDVDLLSGTCVRHTVVVTTGSVTGPKSPAGAWVILDAARLHAPDGSIDIPLGYDEGKSHFQAGGTVTAGSRPHETSRAEVGVKDAAFDIRFVAPEDFGVRGVWKAGGWELTAVEAWSPLARYDVRPGDVIARVGFDTTRTADALRRALRRGLMDEAAVFHVVRGGERLTRVVYLDGVPRRP